MERELNSQTLFDRHVWHRVANWMGPLYWPTKLNHHTYLLKFNGPRTSWVGRFQLLKILMLLSNKREDSFCQSWMMIMWFQTLLSSKMLSWNAWKGTICSLLCCLLFAATLNRFVQGSFKPRRDLKLLVAHKLLPEWEVCIFASSTTCSVKALIYLLLMFKW